jgi:predicted DNA-binding transcriptional regulator AlpA
MIANQSMANDDNAATADNPFGTEAAAAAKPARLISKKEVLARVGISSPTLWLWQRQSKFPRGRDLGGNKTCFLESEIEAWILARPIRKLLGDP